MAALVEELLQAPDPDKRTGYLTEASIYSGTVSIDDRHAGNVWKAENLEIHLARGDRGVAGSFRATVPQFGDPARISGNVLLPWTGDQFEIDVKLQRFAASSIGLIETGLSILANANVYLEGDAHATISRTGELGPTQFSLAGSNGEIALPGLMKAPLPIKTMLAQGPCRPRQ